MFKRILSIAVLICVAASCFSLKPLAPIYHRSIMSSRRYTDISQRKIRCLYNNADKEDLPMPSEASKEDLEETTKKYGLEVGLFKALTTKSPQAVKPQELLAK